MNRQMDAQEFYQLLSYTGDRNLKHQLTECEAFYNYHRLHSGLKGNKLYEILKLKTAALYRFVRPS